MLNNNYKQSATGNPSPGRNFTMARGGDGGLYWRPKTTQEVERDLTPEEREARSIESTNRETARLNALSNLQSAQERMRKQQETEQNLAKRNELNTLMGSDKWMGSVEGREEALRRGMISRPQPGQVAAAGKPILPSVSATTGRRYN
jgi:hypothetical protein